MMEEEAVVLGVDDEAVELLPGEVGGELAITR
jgi:hypothetical protein